MRNYNTLKINKIKFDNVANVRTDYRSRPTALGLPIIRTPNLQMTHWIIFFIMCQTTPQKCYQNLNISSELKYLKYFRKVRLLF
jgi:hypothetical protein